MLADVGGRVGRDQRLDHATACSQGTAHADVGLIEQIVGREQRQRRRDAGPPRVVFERLLRAQHRPFGLDERCRLDHLADVVAPAVVAFQVGRVAVGLLGPPGHRTAHQLADVAEVWFDDGQLIGLQVVGHRQLQRGVGAIPVEADGSPVVLGAVALRFLRSAERQPVDRLHFVLVIGAAPIPPNARRQRRCARRWPSTPPGRAGRRVRRRTHRVPPECHAAPASRRCRGTARRG